MIKITMKPGATDAANDGDGQDEETPPDHQIEHWADTLMRAEEIKNDPKKMKHIGPHLEKKQKAIKSIADLRKRAKDLGAM